MSLQRQATPFHINDFLCTIMNKLGFEVTLEGVCQGYIHALGQAHLGGDFKTFENRMYLLQSIPQDELYEQLKFYGKNTTGLTLPPKLPKLSPQLTDILAFFNRIALYQHPEKYEEVFAAKLQQDDVSKIAEYTKPTDEEIHRSGVLGYSHGLVTNATDLEALLEKLKNDTKNLQIYDAQKNQIVRDLFITMQNAGIIQSKNKTAGHILAIQYDSKLDQWRILDSNTGDPKGVPLKTNAEAANELWKALVVDFGFDVNAPQSFESKVYVSGDHPQIAIENNNLDALKTLAANNVPLDKMDRYGNTPLDVAIQTANFSAISQLMKLGIIPQTSVIKMIHSYKDHPSKLSGLEFALHRNAPKEIEFFTHYKNEGGKELLEVAIEKGDLHTLRSLAVADKLLKAQQLPGIDWNKPLSNGATPIQLAFRNKSLDLVKELMKLGVNIDSPKESEAKSLEIIKEDMDAENRSLQQKANRTPVQKFNDKKAFAHNPAISWQKSKEIEIFKQAQEYINSNLGKLGIKELDALDARFTVAEIKLSRLKNTVIIFAESLYLGGGGTRLHLPLESIKNFAKLNIENKKDSVDMKDTVDVTINPRRSGR